MESENVGSGEHPPPTHPPADFETTFDRLKDVPCRPTKLTLVGLERTDRELVRKELLRVRDAHTLDEVKDAVLDAYTDLMSLGIFDVVDIVIDQGDKPGGTCSIVAKFAEKGPLQLHTGTYVQGQEGSVELSGSLVNPLGRAERVTANAEWGSQSTTEYSLGISRVRPFGAPWLADLRVHQTFNSSERWSSFTQLLRGCRAGLASQDGAHRLAAELDWFRLADPARRASRDVQRQFGDGVRGALEYAAVADRLQWGGSFPAAGWAASLATRLGAHGPGCAAGRFFRQRAAVLAAVPLGRGAAVSVGLEAGWLMPWGPEPWDKPTPITERFFLGGLGRDSLRGFAQRGVGPADVRRPPSVDTSTAESAQPASGSAGQPSAPASGRLYDAVGGDVFVTALAALNFELPWDATRAAGMYGHVWVNAGSSIPLSSAWATNASRDLVQSIRCSMGAGIVWPTRVGKMELNACRVVRSLDRDRIKSGLQFGFTPPAF